PARIAKSAQCIQLAIESRCIEFALRRSGHRSHFAPSALSDGLRGAVNAFAASEAAQADCRMRPAAVAGKHGIMRGIEMRAIGKGDGELAPEGSSYVCRIER